MLWIALGASAVVAALYYAHYKVYGQHRLSNVNEEEDTRPWDAKRCDRLSATLRERFARFWAGIIRNILNLASSNTLDSEKSIDLLSFSPLL